MRERIIKEGSKPDLHRRLLSAALPVIPTRSVKVMKIYEFLVENLCHLMRKIHSPKEKFISSYLYGKYPQSKTYVNI